MAKADEPQISPVVEATNASWGDRRIELACSCVGRCTVLLVCEWDGDEHDPHQTSFDFYAMQREDNWRQRIRSAWRTLRGKGSYHHGIVVDPEQAEQLGAWLLNRIEGLSPPSEGERRAVVSALAIGHSEPVRELFLAARELVKETPYTDGNVGFARDRLQQALDGLRVE